MNMSGTSAVGRQSCFRRTTNHLLYIADELASRCSLERLTGSAENVRALGFLLWREYPQVIFDVYCSQNFKYTSENFDVDR